jgi:hypothetical protein
MAGKQKIEQAGLIDTADPGAGEFELATRYDIERAAKEIEVQAFLAQRFPRDETKAFERLMRYCERKAFAEAAFYLFQRGDADITGPSAPFARAFAACWRNIIYGTEIIRDDGVSRKIRSSAWDVETNSRTVMEAEFKKLVLRKPKDANGRPCGKAQWVTPDERDLRELTNRQAAILERNCILKLMPPDYVDDAIALCMTTDEKNVAGALKANIEKMVKAFAELNIPPERFLKRVRREKVEDLTAANIVALRAVYRAISDGHLTIEDAFPTEGPAGTSGKGDGDFLQGMKAAPPEKTAQPSNEPATGQPAPGPPVEAAGAPAPALDLQAEASEAKSTGIPNADPADDEAIATYLASLMKPDAGQEAVDEACRIINYPTDTDPIGLRKKNMRLTGQKAIARLANWWRQERAAAEASTEKKGGPA